MVKWSPTSKVIVIIYCIVQSYQEQNVFLSLCDYLFYLLNVVLVIFVIFIFNHSFSCHGINSWQQLNKLKWIDWVSFNFYFLINANVWLWFLLIYSVVYHLQDFCFKQLIFVIHTVSFPGKGIVGGSGKGSSENNNVGSLILFLVCGIIVTSPYIWRGCRGHDRMVVGFTTTCAIRAYHHLGCLLMARSTQYYIMW